MQIPNRTGETGTFDEGGGGEGQVSLNGQPLTGMRTFADAELAGKIYNMNETSVSIQAASDPNRWIVAHAQYLNDPPRISIVERQDESASPIQDDEDVEVVVCFTMQAIDEYLNPGFVG